MFLLFTYLECPSVIKSNNTRPSSTVSLLGFSSRPKEHSMSWRTVATVGLSSTFWGQFLRYLFWGSSYNPVYRTCQGMSEAPNFKVFPRSWHHWDWAESPGISTVWFMRYWVSLSPRPVQRVLSLLRSLLYNYRKDRRQTMSYSHELRHVFHE